MSCPKVTLTGDSNFMAVGVGFSHAGAARDAERRLGSRVQDLFSTVFTNRPGVGPLVARTDRGFRGQTTITLNQRAVEMWALRLTVAIVVLRVLGIL